MCVCVGGGGGGGGVGVGVGVNLLLCTVMQLSSTNGPGQQYEHMVSLQDSSLFMVHKI